MDPDRNEERWLSLAQAVSRGDAVDWDRLEQQAVDDEENGVVRALRILGEVARVHRSTGATTIGGAVDTGRSAPDHKRWRHLVILERVGEGTFGAIYRAREEGLDRDVALKLLWPRVGDTLIDSSAVLNEARLLARVRHPNVVTVHGAESIDGRVGLWMEFIRGRTLEDLLTANGPFGAREAAAIGIDLCHALAAVHGAGLLHRDVKSRNVMREEGGRIVLMDFGASADASVHQPDAAGTPVYLAPELFEGAPPSVAADVYSLGVLIHHLVSGFYPVEGQTKEAIRQAHARRERRRLRDSRPDLPDAFVSVVERALAHDPKERHQTAGTFADELSASLGFSRRDSSGGSDWTDNSRWTPRPARAGRHWMRAAALVLITSAAGATLWWGITSGARGRNQQRAPAEDAGKAPANGSPADPSSYEIGARFHAVKAGTSAVLRSGDRLTPGDRLFLTIQTSKPAYVYVINQDEQGESYLMFPLPGQTLTDPLPAGELHRLPGPQSGEELYWQVTSAGGREHFFIFASPRQLEAFERFITALPRPQLGKPVVGVQLSQQVIGTLRGVGGLAKTDAASGVAASMAFPFATPLLEAVETARGFWAREIVFDNPGK